MNFKQFKKFISVFMFIVILATALPLASCSSDKYADTITVVWYPNESASDYEGARTVIGDLITKATGKKVEHKLTTDYSIAIEAIASGTAQICFMGAQGYVEANNKSKDVQPLIVNSGASGTLDDAIYYSWFAVNTADADEYKSGDSYSIDNIQGKRMSFVSNSSTSGFKIPTNAIITLFGATDKWKGITTDDLIEGGSDKFFSEVLFGGSHQGSAVNLLTDKADVAAFCDTEMAIYMDLVSGTENTAGAVYQVKSDAAAPFDTLAGAQCTVIKSTPVLNGPFAYNKTTLSPDDAKKIQDLFTSDEVTNNTNVFVIKDSGVVGMFKKTDKECFLTVDDSWYDPIRNMK
jgi:ABC-type phosphate/phosphonate transport system, periplasmic component